ncbi:hypothetical protein Goshw_029475, partial [Gossypium schwendimanii]|nr:hypothetical protein [Gossypium schwendimanii]
NRLTAALPDLSILSSLRKLSLSGNQLEGPLPVSIGKMSQLVLLDVSSNSLHGVIFENLPCSELNYLNLSSNKISGSIPNLPLEFGELPLIDLSSNLFHGPIPLFLFNSFSLDLSNNMTSGSLSFFCTMIMNIDLDYLDLSNNLLSGLLDLGDNKLTGIIPPWIGERLDGLIVLRLRSNEFHGNIPSTLCLLLFLQVLDLSLNNTSGVIPSCLNKLTVMTYLWEGSFDITDDDNFIFSFNDHLKWRNPSRISKFGEGLINLNLSRNMLRGSIIREIGQSKSLDSLDLSTNNLSGETPESMSELSFLSVLDLSNNKLSGKIPSSSQLQSFNAISYSGNLRQCGEPLRKCPEDEPPKLPNNGGIERSSEGCEGLFEPLVFYCDGYWVPCRILGDFWFIGDEQINNGTDDGEIATQTRIE